MFRQKIVSFILAAAFVGSSTVNAFDHRYMIDTSYPKNEERFPSVPSLLELIYTMAPAYKASSNKWNADQVHDDKMNLESCVTVNAQSAPSLGAIDPRSYESMQPAPDAFAMNYLQGCAATIIKKGFVTAEMTKYNAQIILENEGLQALNAEVVKLGLNPNDWNKIPIAKLSPEVRALVAEKILRYYSGPDDVALSMRLFGPNNRFRTELNSLKDASNFVSTRFLAKYPNDSLLLNYMRIAILIGLGPALKDVKKELQTGVQNGSI